MADNNTLNFDLDAPAVPTLTLDPTPEAAEEKKPAPPAAEKPASPVRETPAPAAPASQEEKPDELDIDLLLEEIKRM